MSLSFSFIFYFSSLLSLLNILMSMQAKRTYILNKNRKYIKSIKMYSVCAIEKEKEKSRKKKKRKNRKKGEKRKGKNRNKREIE